MLCLGVASWIAGERWVQERVSEELRRAGAAAGLRIGVLPSTVRLGYGGIELSAVGVEAARFKARVGVARVELAEPMGLLLRGELSLASVEIADVLVSLEATALGALAKPALVESPVSVDPEPSSPGFRIPGRLRGVPLHFRDVEIRGLGLRAVVAEAQASSRADGSAKASARVSVEGPMGRVQATVAWDGATLLVVPSGDELAELRVPGLGAVSLEYDSLSVDPGARRAIVARPRLALGVGKVAFSSASLSQELGTAGFVVAVAGGALTGIDGIEDAVFERARLVIDKGFRLRRLELDAVRADVSAPPGRLLSLVRPEGSVDATSSLDKGPSRATQLLDYASGVELLVKDAELSLGYLGWRFADATLEWRDGILEGRSELFEGQERRGTLAMDWAADDASEGEETLPKALHLRYSGSLLFDALRQRIERDGQRFRSAGEDRVELSLTRAAGALGFKGSLSMTSWAIEAVELAEEEVRDVGFFTELEGRLSEDRSELDVTFDPLEIGPLKLALELSLRRGASLPKMKLSVRMPRQACDNMLRAVPPGLRSDLAGMWLGGKAEFALSYEVDFTRVVEMYTARAAGKEKPYKSDFVLEGENGCRVTSAPRRVDAKALLRDDFVHAVTLEDGSVVTVGPGTESFVPYVMLPPLLRKGAVVTEDRAFFEHAGINPSLIRTAFEMDVYAGRFMYGGSTITQQLVKNLFFTRSKTLARKLQEWFVALYLETELSKERILELYLNCIEFGRGVYGIEPAAQQYFGKHCWDLLPEEVAFLMMCKPSPKDCQRLFDRQRGVRGVWREKVDFVLGRLTTLAGVIDEAEHQAALRRPIRFASPD